MNQLEHLKALRDKARIQTEQAEAVLKQQGEISESLDKLIAALEETDDGDVAGIDKMSLPETAGAALAAVAVPPTAPKSDDASFEISGDGKDSIDGIAEPEEEGVVESLGQLIANLEESPDAGPVDAFGEESDKDQDSVEWVSEESGSQEEEDDKISPPRLKPIVWEVSDPAPVGGGDPAEATDPDEAEVTAPAIAAAESSESEDGGSDYKFVKLGGEGSAEGSDQSGDSDDDSKGIAPLAGLAAAGTAAVAGAAHLLGGDDSEDKEEIGIGEEDVAVNEADDTAPLPPLPPSLGIEPVAASVNDEQETAKEAADDQSENEMPPVPVPAGSPPPPKPVLSDTPPPPIPVPPGAVSGLSEVPPVPQPEPEPVSVAEPEPAAALAVDDAQVEGAHSSNIFFDANSAYLKESELTKLKTIADAVAGSEARVVKIQGLEDLASSNDFKELLASRRLLAVRKRLAEHGLEESQLTVGEIKLSDEGRVLEPPSISMVPA